MNNSNGNNTPKIIHFLWLNFNKKADGALDEKLTFFKDRIISLHKDWQINFVSKWNECLDSIKNEEWLLKLLDNPFIGPAHKSDALRYYYLYTMGGVWVDISTFLVSPLDDLISQNKDGFTCYYMPSDVAASWIIKITSDIYESITVKEYQDYFIPIQENTIKIKNKSFDFIPENYFLISSIHNEVCGDVLEQLKSYWTDSMKRINSVEDYCYENNKLIFDLCKNIYDFDIKKYAYLNLANNKNNRNQKKEIMPKILKYYFECGYFFNYLQLYNGIINYSIKNNGILKNVENSNVREKIIKQNKLSSFSQALCYQGACNEKIIEFKNMNKNIHLLSASYNRLSKWSNKREKRLTWEDTLAGDIIKGENPSNILSTLKNMEVEQLKFSAFTRNSPAVLQLMKLFKNNINKQGGNYKKYKYYKTSKGYFYKVLKNGEKKRISNEEYNKRK